MEGRIQVAAYGVCMTVAVCVHDIRPTPTPPSTPHSACMHTGKHKREGGCAYTDIDDASQDKGKGVRVQLSQRICVPVSYILWIPLPPCTDEARGRGDTGKGVTQSGSRRSAPGADHHSGHHSERRRGRGAVCRHTLPTVHYTSYMQYMAQFTGRGGGVTSICRTEWADSSAVEYHTQ